MKEFLKDMKDLGLKGSLTVSEYSEDEWIITYTINRLGDVEFKILKCINISLQLLGVNKITVNQTTNGLQFKGYISNE